VKIWGTQKGTRGAAVAYLCLHHSTCGGIALAEGVQGAAEVLQLHVLLPHLHFPRITHRRHTRTGQLQGRQHDPILENKKRPFAFAKKEQEQGIP
jgi:hypothetical protein